MTAGSVIGFVMSVDGPTVVAIVRSSMPAAKGVIEAACPSQNTCTYTSEMTVTVVAFSPDPSLTHRVAWYIAVDQTTLSVQLLAHRDSLSANVKTRQICNRSAHTGWKQANFLRRWSLDSTLFLV
jgi:hypothetical protein